MATTIVTVNPSGPGRRAPPKHRCASALAAAAAAPGGGCSSGAPALERTQSSTTTSRRRLRRRRSWLPRSSRQTCLGLGTYYLRNISRRLRKQRPRSVVAKGSSPSSSMAAAGAVDDVTARRERAEAVARAISYCKDTLRRRSMPTPPPSPSPSLDDWLLAADDAEQHCDDCRDDFPSATRRRPCRTAGCHLGVQTTMAKQSPCPCSASACRYCSRAAAIAGVAHGEESPAPHHGHDCRGESMRRSSLDELEFLKTFDGDEEMINRHFITLEIPRSGSQVFSKQSLLDMKMKRLDMSSMRRKIRVSLTQH